MKLRIVRNGHSGYWSNGDATVQYERSGGSGGSTISTRTCGAVRPSDQRVDVGWHLVAPPGNMAVGPYQDEILLVHSREFGIVEGERQKRRTVGHTNRRIFLSVVDFRAEGREHSRDVREHARGDAGTHLVAVRRRVLDAVRYQGRSQR